MVSMRSRHQDSRSSWEFLCNAVDHGRITFVRDRACSMLEYGAGVAAAATAGHRCRALPPLAAGGGGVVVHGLVVVPLHQRRVVARVALRRRQRVAADPGPVAAVAVAVAVHPRGA
jgi:hypothetical protein